MFPILVWIYRRLSMQEEKAAAAQFGEEWDTTATPGFVPRIDAWGAADSRSNRSRR